MLCLPNGMLASLISICTTSFSVLMLSHAHIQDAVLSHTPTTSFLVLVRILMALLLPSYVDFGLCIQSYYLMLTSKVLLTPAIPGLRS